MTSLWKNMFGLFNHDYGSFEPKRGLQQAESANKSGKDSEIYISPENKLARLDDLKRGSNWSYSSRVYSFNSSPQHGTISQSKKITETSAGRETITYTQNENGDVEEHREFIPRKDLPSTSQNPRSIFEKIFRPKI